jgi:hypothetical protein
VTWNKCKKAGKWAIAILGAISTLILSCKEWGSVHLKEDLEIPAKVAAFYAALVAALLPLMNLRRQASDARVNTFKNDIVQILGRTIYQIMRDSGVRGEQLGVHAFEVTRTGKGWGRKGKIEVQRRIGRWRLRDYPPPSGTLWTKEKGVIGLCWQRKKTVGADISSDFGHLRSFSEADFNALPPEKRPMGLSYDEWLHTREYGAIVACPIKIGDEETYKGCISVDAPSDCYEKLWCDRVRDALAEAASGVRGAMERRDA